MKKAPYKLALASAIGGVLMLSGISTASAAELTRAAIQPTASTGHINVDTDGMYLVRLAEPAVAVYDGGIKGLSATSAQATGSKKLNTKSKAAQKYKKFLDERQSTVLKNAGSKFGRNLDVAYTYQWATNGFAAVLTKEEAKALRSMDGVASVEREKMQTLLTDAGPAWIGAPSVWNNNPAGSRGEGVVVAILDTGINSDHPSFAAVGGDGYQAVNPLGSGNYVPGSYCDTTDANFCNDKLIGAWDFDTVDGPNPEDEDGHGSHTASTAAGNVVLDAPLDAPTVTAYFNISGVAPHANIIAYDVCHWTATGGSCPGSATAAAIDQVVVDAANLPNGIAALNYSISGGGDPWNDYVELGFLAAVQAGVYVAASAGNSGPAASTVAHLGPWVSTTAASTHNRRIVNALVDLTSDGSGASDISGLGLTAAYGPAPILNAADFEADYPGSTLCGQGVIGDYISPWPENFFDGEIVVCTRGTYGRTEKGANALAAGAGGFVLIDTGGGLVADGHVLPGVHITAADGAVLSAWLAANAGNDPMATIDGYSFNYDASNGDIMAGFSSRGPQLAFSSLKPDLTGPGVDIIGADADVFGQYQVISGTSMSSPHNAGAGALMTAMRPDMSPQEIKSAIMMTASTVNMVKEDGYSSADPFDMGAGRIDLAAAKKAGLAMSETTQNFVEANPLTGGDPSTLNIASMQDNNCVGTCSWTREVWNPEGNSSHWNVTTTAPDGVTLSLDVSPKSNSNANNLKLKKGQSAVITVTADTTLAADGWSFGTLNLSSNGNSGPDLHMPIAINSAKATDPELFTKTVDVATAAAGDTLTYEMSVTNGQLTGPITVTDMVPAGTTFVGGSEMESVVNGSTTSAWSYNAGTNSMSWTGELDPGGLDISADPGGSVAGFLPLSLLGIAPLPLTCNGDCDDGGYYFTGLPAYTFNGQTYTSVLFSVNGTVEAGDASLSFSSFSNQDLPDPTPPNNILAPFWRDLNMNAGGSMTVGILSVGCGTVTAYEWNEVPLYDSADTVSMQVWIGNDGGCAAGLIHYTYGAMTNTAAGGTVGVENSDGTNGFAYFYNGAGTAPVEGDELLIQTLNGGSATLGFQVTTDACAPVVNEAEMSNNGDSERAIALTTCP